MPPRVHAERGERVPEQGGGAPVPAPRTAAGVPVPATPPTPPAPAPPPPPLADGMIPVELGGVTRFIDRSDVLFASSQGDYVRLHTAAGTHLLRLPLASLAEEWAVHGFLRIHRSHLVQLRRIDELRMDPGRCTVRIGSTVLDVSRRHVAELREVLLRRTPAARRMSPRP